MLFRTEGWLHGCQGHQKHAIHHQTGVIAHEQVHVIAHSYIELWRCWPVYLVNFLWCEDFQFPFIRKTNLTMGFSDEQLHTLAIVERCASVLSILGIATIMGTFWFSRQFRNPIHRIVFINAFYNLFDVVATTIALSGPTAGNHSALCQFQGFLMQMYVQSWQSRSL